MINEINKKYSYYLMLGIVVIIVLIGKFIVIDVIIGVGDEINSKSDEYSNLEREVSEWNDYQEKYKDSLKNNDELKNIIPTDFSGNLVEWRVKIKDMLEEIGYISNRNEQASTVDESTFHFHEVNDILEPLVETNNTNIISGDILQINLGFIVHYDRVPNFDTPDISDVFEYFHNTQERLFVITNIVLEDGYSLSFNLSTFYKT